MRRSTPKARNWTTVLLAVVAIGAGLVASGTLDPVLSAAVTMALNHEKSSGPTLNAAPVADWQYFDDRPEWSSQRGVPQVEGVQQPTAPTRPLIAPPENPIHFIFNGPPPMPHYSLAPKPGCPQPRGPNRYVERFLTTVSAGTGTATWWDLGDPDTVSYDLVAVPLYINLYDNTRNIPRPTTVRANVPAPNACKQMTATVTGLTSGTSYLFTLQAINTSRVQTGRTYVITRAQSQDFLIP
jgi:hypothetical protein